MNTAKVLAITGASPRQLQWLDENGVVSVRIENHQRQYSKIDVELVRVWRRARQCGLGYKASRRAVEAARRRLATGAKVPYIICQTDGVPVIAHNASEVLNCFLISRSPAILVAL